MFKPLNYIFLSIKTNTKYKKKQKTWNKSNNFNLAKGKSIFFSPQQRHQNKNNYNNFENPIDDGNDVDEHDKISAGWKSQQQQQ